MGKAFDRLIDNVIESVTEEELQKKAVAPRVTVQDVDNEAAASTINFAINNTTTICFMTLQNGFCVVGQSAAASSENFDPEIGKRLALSDAKNKLWPLLGFRLCDKLHAAR